MKQAYIVTESESDAEIINKLLPKSFSRSIGFIPGSGDYSAWSKAGTLLFVKHLPVALVINTHTLNESNVREKVNSLRQLILPRPAGVHF